MIKFEYEELVVATNNFSPALLIGKGSHGCVYKATLKQLNNQIVAIKKQYSKGLSKLEHEANILSSLPQSRHLIKLIGTSHDLLVMEYMPNGTLHDLLFETPSPPTWQKRVALALQIARAVQYMHEHLVIHRDVKPTNILFDSDHNAKLADFGLAVRYDDVARVTCRPAGTIGYMDPCYTSPCTLSTANDVFSFGVVLLEIISGTKAIDVSRVPSSILEWALPLIKKRRIKQICDSRVQLPSNMKETIRNMLHIASLCLSFQEDHCRPSMNSIVAEMENVHIERNRFLYCANIFYIIYRKIMQKRKNKAAATTVTVTTTDIVCVAQEDSNEPSYVLGEIKSVELTTRMGGELGPFCTIKKLEDTYSKSKDSPSGNDIHLGI